MRSIIDTAVVSSGRNLPPWSKGQWLARPRLRRSYAAAMNGKKSWPPVASSGAKAELVEDHQVDAEHGVDDATHRVVGQPAVQRLHQIGGGEVADAQARLHGGVTDPQSEDGICRCRHSTPARVVLVLDGDLAGGPKQMALDLATILGQHHLVACWRSTARRTVLWVVPSKRAAAR
jgi:hypothetical protein